MPDAQTLSTVQQLGSTGFALLLLWWIYKDCSNRLDKKDQQFAELHEKVRGEITAALIAATSTNREAAKIMERVINYLDKHQL